MTSIVNAVGKSAACDGNTGYWENTAIVVTWGDWGGWYDHEPPAIARFRVQRYEEKSYPAGVRPGTPNTQVGAFQYRALDDHAEDRVVFKVTKSRVPNRDVSKIYSPVSGVAGFAHNMNLGIDVTATIIELAESHMVVAIHDSVPGHTYRYHWRVSILI